MDIENTKLLEEILLGKTSVVSEGLLGAYPGDGLAKHLHSGCRQAGEDKVEVFLSFRPEEGDCKACIDLVFCVGCSPRGLIFSSEIAWSDGRVIDDVVVCEICPDCFDELVDRLDRVMAPIMGPLVERMTGLLDYYVGVPQRLTTE